MDEEIERGDVLERRLIRAVVGMCFSCQVIC